MNTKLAVDFSGNHYCGPMVLAAILGCTTAEAAAKVRQVTGTDRAIKGMLNSEVRKVLMANGYGMYADVVPKERKTRKFFGKLYVKEEGPTLAAWLRSRKDVNTPYIVNVGHHYVLVKGRKFVDTYTKGEWVFIRSAPHRRRRVTDAWRIVKAPACKPIRPVL